MRGFYRILFLLIVCGFFPSLGFAQAVLGKTDLGKSQNTSEDLANSLKAGPQRVGKGEKKSEVDPKTLQSKTMKDPTFQGGLNDLGLDWNGNGVGKPHGSQGASESDSKTGKQSDAEAKKAAPAKSAETGENKESKSTSSKPEKQPEKEKTSDTGGNH